MDQQLTLHAAAKLAKANRSSLRRAIHAGRLFATKIKTRGRGKGRARGDYQINSADLIKFVRQSAYQRGRDHRTPADRCSNNIDNSDTSADHYFSSDILRTASSQRMLGLWMR